MGGESPLPGVIVPVTGRLPNGVDVGGDVVVGVPDEPGGPDGTLVVGPDRG